MFGGGSARWSFLVIGGIVVLPGAAMGGAEDGQRRSGRRCLSPSTATMPGRAGWPRPMRRAATAPWPRWPRPATSCGTSLASLVRRGW